MSGVVGGMGAGVSGWIVVNCWLLVLRGEWWALPAARLFSIKRMEAAIWLYGLSCVLTPVPTCVRYGWVAFCISPKVQLPHKQ